MHPKAAIVAFALAGTILGNPALTQEMRAVAPVFAQLVTYPLPQGFVPAHEAAAEGQYIHESIPAGETLQVWSQMMTLTGLQGAGGFPPSDFALMMLQGYESACPESFAASPLGMPEVPGARGGFAVHMSCGTVAGQFPARSEEMLLVVLAGAEDLYTVQWAERGPPQAGPLPFDADRWAVRYLALSDGLALCTPVPGEGPPFPSCTGN